VIEALTAHVHSAAPGSDLRVDIGAVTFIDARGVRALVEAGDAAATNDIRFRVVNQPSCLQRLVEIVGVEAGAWR
jgi:anti-anti-sigma regulatory factor